MISRFFNFDGCRLKLIADELSHFEWLAEFYDYPVIDEPDEVIATVTLCSDRHRLEQGQLSADQANCASVFTYDDRDRCIPQWRANQCEFALDPELNTLIELRGQYIQVIGEDDLGAARVCWLRVVRELHQRWLVQCGFSLLHAAAVALPPNNEVVLLVGAKKSGKSTLLTYLVGYQGAAYVTNDRAAVHPDGRVIAIPTIVSIRPGTFDHLDHLPPLGREHRSSYAHRRSLRELVTETGEPLTHRKNPFSGTPAQYRQWLGSGNINAGSALAVLFPQISEAETPKLVPVQSESPFDKFQIKINRVGMFAGLVPQTKSKSTPCKFPSFVCYLGQYPVKKTHGLLGELLSLSNQTENQT